MKHKILGQLEFDRIQEAVRSEAVTALGQKLAGRMRPSSDPDKVQQRLDETADGATILRLRGGLPVAAVPDITTSLKRAEIGGVLDGTEFAGIVRVLRTVTAIDDFLTDLHENVDLRRVYQMQAQLTLLPGLLRELQRSIDEEGNVTDEASPELHGIRRRMHAMERDIRERMEGYTRGNSAQYLSEPIITIRDDRYVIPVKAENRGRFGGVVHDQSATGQTLFIEPQAVVDLNNRMRETQVAERQEIMRVLTDLSAKVAPETDGLRTDASVLGHLDLINAKARYAALIKATEPTISDAGVVDLRQARHPLIDQHKVVPNDIVLGGDYQSIVITGPNTGGKTVTLKTLGLLSLMAQAGLFIPVDEHSTVKVFSNVFADIGDEQSIEQNLSTFSSHMTNVVAILRDLDKDSLALFDELGAGTDPQEGAALAISILDAVGTVGAYVVDTTHYPELKLYGYNTPGTTNASMAFDGDTLQPTYRLQIGVPGRSNAFEISTRLGLDQTIVDRAKLLISDDEHDLNNMIADLEKERQAAAMTDSDLQEKLDEATKLHGQLQAAYADLKMRQDKELQAARDQANKMVADTQAEADQIIKSLRKMQRGGANDAGVIDAQTRLHQLHQDTPLAKNKVLKKARNTAALRAGDTVKVLQYGQTGTLLKQQGNHEWQVQVGIMKMAVPESGLEKVGTPETEQPRTARTHVQGAGSGPSTTLDLRGQRYAEAMSNLDKYIDEALLANYPTVTIIHGLGTGAIRNGVAEYLKNNRNVARFGYAPANAGGSGATIVVFR